MKGENEANADLPGVTILTSSSHNPYNFEVIITEEVNSSECIFQVTGKDPITCQTKKCVYNLADRSHSAYLNLFAQLSYDFGLRVPQNRLPPAKHSHKIPYSEVLKENLVPGMLFGYGDPAVIRLESDTTQKSSYYMVVTSNDAPDSFPICHSSDLEDWKFAGFVFPAGKKPDWASDGLYISDYWAPEMHYVGKEFRVYFSAREKQSLELCIGLAKSPDPEGPFVAGTVPIIKGNTIDPHIFSDDKETSCLFWKEDNNGVWPSRLIDLLYENPALITELFGEEENVITASFIQTLWPWIQNLKSMEGFLALQIFIEAIIPVFSNFRDRLETLQHRPDLKDQITSVLDIMRTPIYAQHLSPDGTTLVGERTKIIENDLAWEAHLVEGIWVTKHNNKYYLFYAGNDFSTDQYGIGVAIADSLLGPYIKMGSPFLKSTDSWWAPGHPSVIKGPDNQYLMFLHAYFPQKAGYKEFRALLSIPIIFHDRGVSFG